MTWNAGRRSQFFDDDAVEDGKFYPANRSAKTAQRVLNGSPCVAKNIA
jgi:hypothetical protein